MALGARYVELETIRREIAAERQRTAEAVQAVLTPAQRMRTAALQEVLRNYGLACEALNTNLMTLPALAPGRVITATPDPATGVATFLLGVPFCPTAPLLRTGDFTFTPGQP
jgi:hypothetical protein